MIAEVSGPLAALRDYAVWMGSISAAALTILTLAKAPGIRRPVRWFARKMTEDVRHVYWERHREVAAEAVAPQVLGVSEQVGRLAHQVERHGVVLDRHTDQLEVLSSRVQMIDQRTAHIEPATEATERIVQGIAETIATE